MYDMRNYTKILCMTRTYVIFLGEWMWSILRKIPRKVTTVLAVTLRVISRSKFQLCISKSKAHTPKFTQNTLFLSEMIGVWYPCKPATSSTNFSSTIVLYTCFKLMKCAYLLRRSTTTKNHQYSSNFGSYSMKSIEITNQICEGSGICWSKSAWFKVK